ncbi:MAG TPA: GNAT family N-acetyltransferase [Gemmatimonadaceae bacterium]|nr:GNAT family N-acetyltransferase [Gemmatimonadaceae bacterium]
MTESASRSPEARPVVIRRATSADLPRLGRLGALLVEVHHAFDAQRFLPARDRMPADYAAFLLRQLEKPSVAVLVADDVGDVVGYAYGVVEGYDYMALRGPAGVLHDIIVDPEARGRGVGRRLLDAVIEDMRARGAPRLVLSTAARNEAAQRLFASAGFRPTMIEMTRELSAGSP